MNKLDKISIAFHFGSTEVYDIIYEGKEDIISLMSGEDVTLSEFLVQTLTWIYAKRIKLSKAKTSGKQNLGSKKEPIWVWLN